MAEDGGGATAPGEAAALRGAVPSSPLGAGKGSGGTERPVPQPEATPGAQWGCAVCYFGVLVK